MDEITDNGGRAVPSGRLARLGQFGRLAGGVAGGMIAEGARRLADGERPRVGDMLLTPANVGRVADRLAHLRGAAMKLGQMISMDAGDLLPAELTQILARLRSGAQHMPPQQLNAVLTREYGANWRRRFRRFEASPMAAASIGQVHRAVTHDGRELAIKVQYPGVAGSIDADIDNVATLLRVSGLLPKELDIAPLLGEAKRQLAQEADYLREGREMERFRGLLAGSPEYVVPQLEPEFTTATVLAMTYLPGKPIESLVDAPQDVRDRVVEALLSLVLRELFEFGAMQTDPNFANYRYRPETGQLVLLDFGAAQTVAAGTSAAYGTLVTAALKGERDAVREAALAIGFLGAQAVAQHRQRLDRMIDVVLDKFAAPGAFDFGDRAFVEQLRPDGMAVAADKSSWHLPPADLLFVQRKISGTALLAARLGARIDLRALLGQHLPPAS
jgi:predicted unusual protein kinase regulating ubiquinone biosynthesis (AarF/ABC1/UbiB family)